MKQVAKSLLPKFFYRILHDWGTRLFAPHAQTPPNINTRNYWNSVWDGEGLDLRDKPELHDHIIDIMPENSKVIDLGCGNGQLLRKLGHKKSAQCIGLDFSDAVLDKLRQYGIETIHAILPDIPFMDGAFD